MSVKARWHQVEVEVDRSDPFADTPPRVEEVGKVIHVTDPPTLNLQLIDLVRREGDLFNAGVTCQIRDTDGTCCSACPVVQSEGDLAPLCHVGKQQERVLTQLAASRARP